VDAGDGRLGQFVEGAHQPRQRQRVLAVVRLAGLGHAAHPVEVGAGRERGAFAFDHHHPHARVGAGGLQGAGQGGDQDRVEGVVQLGAVQAQAGDRTVAQAQQRVVHRHGGSL